MARKQPPRPAAMWDEAEEVPRAGIPSTDKLQRRMTWSRRIIWAVVVTFPILVLSLFVTVSALRAATRVTPVVADVDTQTRSAAMTAVVDWLAGDPPPLPGGELVSWDDAQTLPTFKGEAQGVGGTTAATVDLQAHTLTVRDSTGMQYRAQVLVATNTFGEVTVIGAPSVLPVAPSSNWASGLSPWPNQQSTTTSDSVETAVGAWVDAFTSGDPEKLRVTVGDPDGTHAYMPMVGLAGADHEVGPAAWLLDGSGERTSQMLVQVSVQFSWPGTDSTRTAAPAATYDLLVDGADSAAPRVVAWGGSGTGPILVRFQNAIVGRDLQGFTPAPTARPTGSTTDPTPEVTAPSPDGGEAGSDDRQGA